MPCMQAHGLVVNPCCVCVIAPYHCRYCRNDSCRVDNRKDVSTAGHASTTLLKPQCSYIIYWASSACLFSRCHSAYSSSHPGHSVGRRSREWIAIGGPSSLLRAAVSTVHERNKSNTSSIVAESGQRREVRHNRQTHAGPFLQLSSMSHWQQ
jgi:hypothetical protein